MSFRDFEEPMAIYRCNLAARNWEWRAKILVFITRGRGDSPRITRGEAEGDSGESPRSEGDKLRIPLVPQLKPFDWWKCRPTCHFILLLNSRSDSLFITLVLTNHILILWAPGGFHVGWPVLCHSAMGVKSVFKVSGWTFTLEDLPQTYTHRWKGLEGRNLLVKKYFKKVQPIKRYRKSKFFHVGATSVPHRNYRWHHWLRMWRHGFIDLRTIDNWRDNTMSSPCQNR